MLPLPKLLVLRSPAEGETPFEVVAGQKLLQLGVRVVQYPSVKPGKGRKHREKSVRDSGAVLHQVDYLPQFNESPIPRVPHTKPLRQFTEIRDLSEFPSHSPKLSTINELTSSLEETKGPPLTMEELTSSLPVAQRDELRDLRQFRLEVAQSLPDLVPWEQRYQLASEQLRDYSEQIGALRSQLVAKDQDLERARAQLATEVRDRETIAVLQKLTALDRALTHHPHRPAQAAVTRRQVGLRYKVPKDTAH